MNIRYEDIDDDDMHDFGLACCPAHIRNGPKSDYLDWLELNYRPDWQDAHQRVPQDSRGRAA